MPILHPGPKKSGIYWGKRLSFKKQEGSVKYNNTGYHRFRKALFLVLLAGVGAAFGCDSTSPIPLCSRPEIISSRFELPATNVLSALITAHVRATDSIALRFGIAGGPLESWTPAVTEAGDSALVPLLGLRDLTRYDVQAVAFNDCTTTPGPMLTFTTDKLPADLPKFSASGVDPSPGYVTFAAGNYGMAIDNTGRAAWYHRFANGPGLNFQPQPNGRYTARPPAMNAGEIAKWVEVDPLGNVTRTLTCAEGLQPRLHDLLAESNGSYWLMCDRIQTVDLSSSGGPSQARVMGTGVQHISGDGKLLFDWSAFDHIDVELQDVDGPDRTANPINWTHGNAFDLDSDGNLLLSFRNLNEIIKINTRTGAVMWRMGGSHNQFSFVNSPLPAFVRQHGVRSIGAGRLQLLDNLGDPRGSRAERYEYDEKARTVRLTGSVASSAGVIALIGGTTQSLPGGRVLVSFGNGGSVEEFDAAGNMTWKIDGNAGYVFRAQRIRSLYSPGVSDPH